MYYPAQCIPLHNQTLRARFRRNENERERQRFKGGDGTAAIPTETIYSNLCAFGRGQQTRPPDDDPRFSSCFFPRHLDVVPERHRGLMRHANGPPHTRGRQLPMLARPREVPHGGIDALSGGTVSFLNTIMANQPLLDYIQQQRRQGIREEQIKNALLANGWQENDLNEAMENIPNDPFPSSLPPVPQQAQASSQGPTTFVGRVWSLGNTRTRIFWGSALVLLAVALGAVAVVTGELSRVFKPDQTSRTGIDVAKSNSSFGGKNDVYVNHEYGFQITLNPRLTRGYSIVEKNASPSTYAHAIMFLLPTTDREQYFDGQYPFMFLNVIDKADFGAHVRRTEGDSFHFTRLAETEKYVFMGMVSPYCPGDRPECNPQEYAKILSTFTFLGQPAGAVSYVHQAEPVTPEEKVAACKNSVYKSEYPHCIFRACYDAADHDACVMQAALDANDPKSCGDIDDKKKSCLCSVQLAKRGFVSFSNRMTDSNQCDNVIRGTINLKGEVSEPHYESQICRAVVDKDESLCQSITVIHSNRGPR